MLEVVREQVLENVVVVLSDKSCSTVLKQRHPPQLAWRGHREQVTVIWG